jgi:5-hydroxyisourate hydrolase
MSQISTHVLDTGLGKPVHGMEITLYKIVDGQRIELASEHTNINGRIENLDVSNSIQESGTYCLHFSTEEYFLQNSISVFYPYVEVVFNINGEQPKYHIPLVLSSFGYSTYRGSCI